MAKRRIKKARIKFISLVPAGANQMPVLYKEDGQVELQSLVKATDDGELLAVVYAPERSDSQGDIANAEVIKEMAYDAMKKGVEIDVRHDLKPLPKDKAFVAESFLIQKGDERFQGFQDYQGNPVESLAGAWATVIKIEDPELRKAYREGQFKGVSMYGQAEVETLKSEDLANDDQFLATLVEKLSHLPDSEDIHMSNEELEALLAKQEERILSRFEEKLAEITKTDDDTSDTGDTSDELVFKGDLTNPADVAAHVEKLKSVELGKALDTNDLEQMTMLQKSLGDAPEVESRVTTLEKNLAQILKGSSVTPNQDSQVNMPDVDWSGHEISKSVAEEIRLGQAMAQEWDKQNGYAVNGEAS